MFGQNARLGWLFGLGSLGTGAWAIWETLHAPARSMALPEDPTGGVGILLHLALAGLFALWIVGRIYGCARPSRRAAALWRTAGWMALPLLVGLTWPPDTGSLNDDPKAIALGALTTLVPVLPTLAGALLFDLALISGRKAWEYVPARATPATVFTGLFGAALAFSWTGLVAFGSALNEYPGPMRFEYLGAPGLLALPIFLLMIPVGFVWMIVAAIRG